MLSKRLDLITDADIQSLVIGSVRESKTIEYKQSLPTGADADKKEFLADVSSFANASGGTLIYGITESRDANGKPSGIPEQATGLPIANADAEVRRLEQIIRDGLEPRIPGIGIKPISGFPDGEVIVIQIPRSWAAPHMVSFKASPRFFARTSAGKSPLDVSELRAAFLQSDEIPKRIRRFREERLGLIVAGETPVPLPQSPLTVLHLVPLSSMLNPPTIDVVDFLDGRVRIPPLGSFGYNGRLNIDGYVSFVGGGRASDQEQCNYSQMFRSGIVEGVDAQVLSGMGETKGFIPSLAFEKYLLDAIEAYFAAYRDIGVDGSIVVMLSLIGVRGFYMHSSARIMMDGVHRIEKSNLLLPDIVVPDVKSPASHSMRSVLDLLWQACGFRRSPNFDEKGEWKPAR